MRSARLLTSVTVPLKHKIAADAVVIMQHKPFGLLSPSTTPRGNKRYARDILTRSNMRGGRWAHDMDPCDTHGLQCAGRLDADSTGLLLWTDSSALVQWIIGPRTPVEKEYIVRVTGHADWGVQQLEDSLALMREGVSLDGRPLRPAQVDMLNDSQIRVVLREGRHRQIRRVCDIVGFQVQALKRVRIGKLRLGGLGVGQWKPLVSVAAAAALLVAP